MVKCFFVKDPLGNEIILFGLFNVVTGEWLLTAKLVDDIPTWLHDHRLDDALRYRLVLLDIIEVFALVELYDDVVLHFGPRRNFVRKLHLFFVWILARICALLLKVGVCLFLFDKAELHLNGSEVNFRALQGLSAVS